MPSWILGETQQISATNDFDGTAPTTTSYNREGVLVYGAGAAGGLFSCDTSLTETAQELREFREVNGVRVKFGGQTTWNIYVVNGDFEYLWLTGTTDTDLISTDIVVLAPKEKLKLVTSGASTAMYATVNYQPYRYAKLASS